MSTGIDWCDEVWNPVHGCDPVSSGCSNCFAKRMAKRLAGRFGYPADDPFRVTLRHDRLTEPLRWKKKRHVFVCSMGDLFHKDVDPEFCIDVFVRMAESKEHVFQLLTKRPERMRAVLSRPEFWLEVNSRLWARCIEVVKGGIPTGLPNLWLGVSAEDQAAAHERIPFLLDTPAAARVISCEPLLGPIDLGLLGTLPKTIAPFYTAVHERIDWVIAGCETGPGARPANPEWFRGLRDQCREVDVPFFLKAMEVDGKIRKMPLLDGAVWNQKPDDEGECFDLPGVS